ncbi:hypothetical protein DSCO28_65580 [Desulfosarcina ovata subsp. sediminis]|uniref:Transporter n=1 Tax=Desulfosarcina ovata subsp. sediminis TaxID=885957 RepID=A0A5K8A0F7_9BACT|nr:transporter [Desulfosarcina ovata]BBO85992.1 hypothetical protein DSCO28_65580 [Desulfosarcina ovata subsp. sediminis]
MMVEMSKQIKRMVLAGGAALLFFLSVYSAEAATLGSHYPFGGEGVLAASVPPPGFHYRIYNTWYNPTTVKDDSGDKDDIDLDVFSTVHRFIHVTQKKILGADYFYNIIVPLVDKDLTLGTYTDSQSLALGDTCFEFFGLAWHKPRWDAAFALAVIAPTGEYALDKKASPGLGYWSGMLTLGGTVYLDAQRSWSLSALTRTLVHTEQDESDVTPGSEFVVEYGLGKEIPVTDKLLVRPGIAGCAYWQIEDDSDDGPGTVADERKRAYALGAEINFFWLPPTLFQVNLRALREFGAKNTVQGSQFVLTLTKSW